MNEYFSNCCHANSKELFITEAPGFEPPVIEGMCSKCGEHAVFEKENTNEGLR